MKSILTCIYLLVISSLVVARRPGRHDHGARIARFEDFNEDWNRGKINFNSPPAKIPSAPVKLPIIAERPIPDVPGAMKKLQEMFKGSIIPRGMPDMLAVLDKTIHILSCLPIIRDGNCYKSGICQLPDFKIRNKMVPFVLKICKDPYRIVIDIQSLHLPWWATVSLQPIIMTFNNNKNDGVFTVTAKRTMTVRVKLINLGVRKGTITVDGIVRYDCTKPAGAHNWQNRVQYNLKAPNKQYTSMFYSLRIRIEIRKRKYFFLGWKCEDCKDLVNESGSYGAGKKSCIEDMQRHEQFFVGECFYHGNC